ncbi:GNAT family N-acetyltransferase [Histidinibacterium aquaticum]|uniref:GNAT family N-acetyltransferase n=2 Tax=Histidinibacterium aquaticum TaxID=2613962 RepID=A0A5J5GJX5_9RHOB|nr:GNAT family N-acetyltransferase [Histidinibacterium aquaticum]
MGADYRALVAAGQVWVESDEQGHMRGFIVFRPEGDAMLLENVAVRPEAAGQGIGRDLIAFCEETARARGCRAVTLYTNEAMTANLTLYPRLGYRETGRRIEDGFRRVYFEKPLTD